MEPLLRVSGLRVVLDGAEILRGLDFELGEAETLAVLGPNGSGKTVLLRALLGIVPYQGTVRWRPGVRLGYVPQGIARSRDLPLTVQDFFALKKGPRRDLAALLAEVGIPAVPVARKPLGLLSAGQFQRVLIAWALAGNPDSLLLDEAASAIDVEGEETLRVLLERLRAERKLSVIRVTHDLSAVYGEADRVLCVGHATSCYGSPTEVLTPERLRTIYGRELKFFSHGPERWPGAPR